MSNVPITLVVPSANGVGAAVDVSALGVDKTVILAGTIEAIVLVEASVDGGTTFCQVTAFGFTELGQKSIEIAAQFMRVRVQGYKRGSGSLTVGGQLTVDNSFATLTVPSGNGVGPSVNVSTFANFWTVIVGQTGRFQGAIALEISQDNVNFAQSMPSFGGEGCASKLISANYARVRRTGFIALEPGPLTMAIGSGVGDSIAAGGGSTLDGAYDFGGAGLGRTINADAGAVQINGAGGLGVVGAVDFDGTLNVDGEATLNDAVTITAVVAGGDPALTITLDAPDTQNAITATNGNIEVFEGVMAVSRDNAETSPIAGLSAFNTTQSTALAPVQDPPTIAFYGSAWDTSPTISRSLETRLRQFGVSGADPSAELAIQMSIDGAGFNDILRMSSVGPITATKQSYTTPFALTDGANIAVDARASNYYTVTLAGNRTLDNPTNLVAGMTFMVAVTQDGTGNRTLAYGANYDFGDAGTPVLSTAAGAIDVLSFVALSPTKLAGTILKGF